MADIDWNADVGTYLNGKAAAVKSSVSNALTTNPDKAAQVHQAAGALAIPAPQEPENQDYAIRQHRLQALGLDDLVKTNPVTTDALADPAVAAQAHDDVGSLTAVENWFKYAGTKLLSGGLSFGATIMRAASGGDYEPNPSAGIGANDPTLSDDARTGIARIDAQAKAANPLRKTAAQLQAKGEDLVKSAVKTNPVAAEAEGRSYFTADPSKSAFLDPTRMAGDALQMAPLIAGMFVAARSGNVAGLEAEGEALAAGATPEAAAAVRQAATLKTLAAHGAVADAVVTNAMQANAAQTHVDALPDDVVRKSSAYRLWTQAGLQDSDALFIARQQAAEAAGGVSALAAGAFGAAAGPLAGRAAGLGGGFIARTLLGAATQAPVMAGQNAAMQVGENVGEGQVDPTVKPGDNVGEAAASGAAFGFGMGAVHGAIGRHVEMGEQAADAQAHAAQLDLLGKLAEASKLRERNPELFQRLIDEMAADGKLSHVYIPAKDFAQHAVSGEDPLQARAVMDALPSVAEQLHEALQSGGDLEIPVGEWASFAGDENTKGVASKLIDHVTTEPGAMSRAGADEFFQNHADELKANVEKALGEGEMRDERQASRDRVLQRYFGELNRVNRFTPDVNMTYAQLHADFDTVMGAHAGLTPEQFAERYPRQFSAETVGGQAFGQPGAWSADFIHELEAQHAEEKAKGSSQPTYVAMMKPDEFLGLTLSKEAHGWLKDNVDPYDPAKDTHDVPVWLDVDQSGQVMGHDGRHRMARLAREGVNEVPVLIRGRNGAEVREDTELKPQRSRSDQNANGYATVKAGRLTPLSGGRLLQSLPHAAIAAPMANMPTRIRVNGEPQHFGPHQPAREAAARYAIKAGLSHETPRVYTRVDAARGKRIAEAFQAMEHNPEDPAVKASYDAMKRETLAQWQEIKATGLKVEWMPKGEDPYQGNPRNALIDVAQNNHLWVFATENGFGSDEAVAKDNPLNQKVKGEKIGDKAVTYNDVFRIVHDYFGHAMEGVGFRADGEENAWRIHAAMYSPEALPAMTAETRGQNSWVNFGPHGDENRTAKSDETIYAPQKIGRLPDWVMHEGREDPTDKLYQHGSRDVVGRAYDPGLGFKSMVAEAIAKGPEKASADQWLATISNTPGVKKEELDWLGLKDWVDLRKEMARGQNTPVTISKAELSDWIAENGLRLQETELGDDPEAMYEDPRFQELEQRAQDDAFDNDYDPPDYHATQGYVDHEEDEDYVILGEEPDEEVEPNPEADLPPGPPNRELFDTRDLGTEPKKHGWYVIDYDDQNGSGHRKLAGPFTTRGEAEIQRDGLLQEHRQQAQEEWWDRGGSDYATEGVADEYRQRYGPKWGSYKLEGGDNYRELLIQLPRGINPKVEGFSGSHWSIDNVMAHARLTDRTDAQGKHVLFIEEVQSDWHQQGREKGYKGEVSDEERRAAYDVFNDAAASAHDARERTTTAMIEAVRSDSSALGLLRQAVSETVERHGDEDAALRKMNHTQVAFTWLSSDARLAKLGTAMKHHYARLVAEWLENLASDEEHPNATPEQRQNIALANKARDLLAAEKLARLRYQEADNATRRLDGGIADAPWKNTWGVLVMKRMIRYAVEGGYDRVAFTTGQISDRVSFGDTGWWYDRNLPNIVNDLIKKSSQRVVDEPLHGAQVPIHEELEALDKQMDRLHQARAQANAMTPNAEHSAEEIERTKTAIDRALVARENRYQMLAEARDAGQRTSPPPEAHFFDVNDKLKDLVEQGIPLFQENGLNPRGSFSPSTSTITMLRNADLSTFLHETGHFFLETLADMAARPDAPLQVKADMDTVLKWVGARDLEDWQSRTLDEQREAHEQFARGFEAFLMEGKAPKPELQHLFQRFRSWLLHVYQSLSRLNVTLTDEVRGVFGRMLASAEEIAEAERNAGYKPIFETKPPHMGDVEWAAYQSLGGQATQTAISTLEARSLRDMKWASGARGEALRAAQRSADTKRKAVREEVSKEVMAEPINRARTFFKRGSDDVEGAHKLSLPALRDMGLTPEDTRKLGYGKYGMVAEEGLHPDAAAQLFGFSSGDELVKTLLSAEDPREKIAGLTDQRTLERYGDLTDPAAIARAADEAVHNDARLRFVATEANALAQAARRTRVLASAAKGFAEQIVGRVKVRELKPSKYEAAERRAARAAEKAFAKGDIVEAATEKRNQLINGYATKAALEGQAAVDKGLRYLAKFDRPGTRKALDPAYRDQIDQLLNRYDLNPNTTLKALDKRKSLADFLKWHEEQGLPTPQVDDALLNEASRKHYKDMTVDELKGLIDTVRSMEHVARQAHKLDAIAKGAKVEAVANEIAEGIAANAYRDPKAPPVEDPTKRPGLAGQVAKGKVWLNGFLASAQKWNIILRDMDGNKEGGPAWLYLGKTMNARADWEGMRRLRATKELVAIQKLLEGEPIGKMEFIPEIGGSLSLQGRLAIALNWGNETNRLRVMEGDKWSPDQVAAILKTLDAKHWAFVQAVWDHLESYKPEVAAKVRRVTGLDQEFVDPTPVQVTTRDGQQLDLRGGYYPIKYDGERSSKADGHEEAATLKQMMSGAATQATTKRGHLKARADHVEMPVRKDLGVIYQHVAEVIHDLAWHEWLLDVNKLFRKSQVEGSIRDYYGNPILKTMRDQIKAMAVGDLPAVHDGEKALQWIRTRTTMSVLGVNLISAVMQPLGLFQTAVRIGPVWTVRGMGHALGDAAHLRSTTEWIKERSEFMRLRFENNDRDLHDAVAKLQGKDKTLMEAAFWLMEHSQRLVDVPTWAGQYEKSLAAHGDEALASAEADQAIRDSQGGRGIYDKAQIERGSEAWKMLTTLYSFFNVTYNQLVLSQHQLRRVGAAGMPRFFAEVMALSIVPNLLQTAVRKALRGDDDWSNLAMEALSDDVGFFLGLLPVLREAGTAITSPRGYSPPSTLRIFTSVGQAAQDAQKGDLAKTGSDALAVTGALTGLPAVQIQRTINGIFAMANGQTSNPAAVLFGAPKKH